MEAFASSLEYGAHQLVLASLEMSKREDDGLESAATAVTCGVEAVHAAIGSNSHSSRINQSCWEELLG